MPKRGEFPSHRMWDGVEEKWCNRCERWRSLRHFYYSPRKRRHIHPCKECRSREESPNGLVLFQPTVEAWLRALVNRVGRAEASRLCGWDKSRVSAYMNRPPRHVHRGTAKLILQAYRDVEASGVVIAKNSVKHGNFERGKAVKFVEQVEELYNRHGDQDTEARRGNRRAHRKTD